MKCLSLLLLLLPVIVNADIAYYDKVVGSGGGNPNYYSLVWGGAPATWHDTNTYIVYLNSDTNGAYLNDISGNNRQFDILPTTVGGSVQFQAGTSSVGYVKLAMDYDRADDRNQRTDITGFTNSATGTINIWRRRQTVPVEVSNYGETLLSYCNATNFQPLWIAEENTGEGIATNIVKIRLDYASGQQWQLETTVNDIIDVAGKGWHLYTLKQDGAGPKFYVDAVRQTMRTNDAAGITAWVTQPTKTQSILLGAWSYLSTLYCFYAGDIALYNQSNYAWTDESITNFYLNTHPTNYISDMTE